MKKSIFLAIGMSVALTTRLRAEPQPSDHNLARDANRLKRDEKTLGEIQSSRDEHQNQMNQAQEELTGGQTQLTTDHDQQRQDIEHLKTVEGQVKAGRSQENLDHISYNEAVKKYGHDASASTEAQQTLHESHRAMKSLRQTRHTLKKNLRSERRLAHNDKTVIDMQKRAVNSDSRYLVQDDGDIKKKETAIANDHHTIVEDRHSSTSPAQ